MPDSILPSTRLHPFPGRYDGPQPRLGFDLEGVHDSRRARQTQTKRAASGEMILEGRLGIVEARALVDGLDLDASATVSGIFKPSHEQVTPSAPVFEDVASELRDDSRYHGRFRCPK